jgi:glycosyltransferase involved in cell wall biosynthesis
MKLIPADVEVNRTCTFEPPFRLRKRFWSRLSSSSESEKVNTGRRNSIKSILARNVKRLLFPDPQVLWYPFAIHRASTLIRKNNIATVLVTAPPFSAFLIATALKRRFPNIHTIVDIRDEWLRYFIKEFAFRDSSDVVRAEQVERTTVQCCDRVVAVTSTSLKEVRSRHPEQPDHKFVLIPNGYDRESFATFRSRPHGTSKLVVTYTGTVYRPCSPKAYLDVLDGLPQIRSEFETRIVGRVSEEFDRSIFDCRRTAVRLFDFVPHEKAITFMEETDILLLPWADRFNVPGKLFEYLATGKPILALCLPGSDVETLIRETSSGWSANVEDPVAIRRVLEEIHALKGNCTMSRNWESIRRYERQRLVAKYAQVIRSCVRPDNAKVVE